MLYADTDSRNAYYYALHPTPYTLFSYPYTLSSAPPASSCQQRVHQRCIDFRSSVP